jgi:hypothetical protein
VRDVEVSAEAVADDVDERRLATARLAGDHVQPPWPEGDRPLLAFVVVEDDLEQLHQGFTPQSK